MYGESATANLCRFAFVYGCFTKVFDVTKSDMPAALLPNVSGIAHAECFRLICVKNLLKQGHYL